MREIFFSTTSRFFQTSRDRLFCAQIKHFLGKQATNVVSIAALLHGGDETIGFDHGSILCALERSSYHYRCLVSLRVLMSKGLDLGEKLTH